MIVDARKLLKLLRAYESSGWDIKDCQCPECAGPLETKQGEWPRFGHKEDCNLAALIRQCEDEIADQAAGIQRLGQTVVVPMKILDPPEKRKP